MKAALSVIICTHNPPKERLRRVVAQIICQLPAHAELLVVDNASVPALEVESIIGPGDRCRVITEPVTGLVHARARGVEESVGELILFVDDDNLLASDYLAQVIEWMGKHPNVGVAAGKALGEFEVEPGWLVRPNIARYAIRDLGDDPVLLDGAIWAKGEPFGAGMVVRRPVAQAFSRLNANLPNGIPLGRSGGRPLSGEDTLFSRIANRLGYKVAYFPAFRLTHIIDPKRLEWRYFCRLMEGQGRSHALLEFLSGRVGAAPDKAVTVFQLLRRFLSRLRYPGLQEAVGHWFWDRGYYDELRLLDRTEIGRFRVEFRKLEKSRLP